MPTLLDAVTSTMQLLMDDEPKTLHIGEAMNCWVYATTLNEGRVICQQGLNTTTDNDLRHLLQQCDHMCFGQYLTVVKFMRNEGVPTPPVSEDKPISDPCAVPLGVKSTDEEIANLVAAKIVAAILQCSIGMTQSIRNDVGGMFLRFLNEQAVFGVSLRNTMRKRGWAKYPPAFSPPGVPAMAT